MAELKTRATRGSVEAFLEKAAKDERLEDCRSLVRLMQQATRAEPKLWGPSIVGFGDIHLVYESGRELDWFKIGFSPRKPDLVLYGLSPEAASLEKLGKHRHGKGCVYIRRLADVDVSVLRQLIQAGAKKKSQKSV